MIARERSAEDRRRIRLASIVIIIAFAGGMALSYAADHMGAPGWVSLMINLAQLVALGWAFWTLIRIWRADGGS